MFSCKERKTGPHEGKVTSHGLYKMTEVMRSSLFPNICSGSITSAALTTFLHPHNSLQCFSPSAALPNRGRGDMNQGKSLSSEKTGGATGRRGMKNSDLARSGRTCLIADAVRVPPPPQLWTAAALSLAPFPVPF